LATGDFDAVTLIHNETSTGVMNPLPEICAVARKYPDVLLIVDTVSSFSAISIPMDDLGIDVLLTGSQKALALPPGFSLFSVSEKALARAEEQNDRGYYFDFLEFKKNQEDDMTPTRPKKRFPIFSGASTTFLNERGKRAARRYPKVHWQHLVAATAQGRAEERWANSVEDRKRKSDRQHEGPDGAGHDRGGGGGRAAPTWWLGRRVHRWQYRG